MQPTLLLPNICRSFLNNLDKLLDLPKRNIQSILMTKNEYELPIKFLEEFEQKNRQDWEELVDSTSKASQWTICINVKPPKVLL